MPLDDLVSVIETLQQRIATHRQSLQGNEIRTRTVLIDPLLTVLGWDVSDPALVTPEYNVDGGWADYALRGAGTQPAAIIEAKRLGTLVENHLNQMVNYCIQEGIAYSGVTDGSHWQLYRTFEPVPLTEKLVLDVNIGNTPAYECALKLLMLWRPNLSSGKAVPAEEPVFTAAWEPETAQTVVDAPVETPVGSNDHSPSYVSDDWTRLSQFNPPTGAQAPSSIRFLDGSTAEIGSWKRIPIATAQWLYAQRLLTVDNIPVPSGSRGFAANSVPVHANGSPMPTHESIGDGHIFINVHLSARAARENAKKLLTHCGASPDDVWLKVET